MRTSPRPRKNKPRGTQMSQLKLSIATTDYDHFRDFRIGLVRRKASTTPG